MQDTQRAEEEPVGDILVKCIPSVAFTVAFLLAPIVSEIFYPTCPPKQNSIEDGNRNTFLAENPLWGTEGLRDVGMYSFHQPVQALGKLNHHLQEMALQIERKF